MSPMTWDPFGDLEEVLDRFGRGRGRAARPREGAGQETVTTADWVPAVDILENETQYLIKAELPEVAKSDVKVSVNAGALVIQGERKLARQEGTKLHRVERAHGSFARSFTLPDDVEEEKIHAEHKEGMLYLYLPKHEKPKPKSIQVNVK